MATYSCGRREQLPIFFRDEGPRYKSHDLLLQHLTPAQQVEFCNVSLHGYFHVVDRNSWLYRLMIEDHRYPIFQIYCQPHSTMQYYHVCGGVSVGELMPVFDTLLTYLLNIRHHPHQLNARLALAVMPRQYRRGKPEFSFTGYY